VAFFQTIFSAKFKAQDMPFFPYKVYILWPVFFLRPETFHAFLRKYPANCFY